MRLSSKRARRRKHETEASKPSVPSLSVQLCHAEFSPPPDVLSGLSSGDCTKSHLERTFVRRVDSPQTVQSIAPAIKRTVWAPILGKDSAEMVAQHSPRPRPDGESPIQARGRQHHLAASPRRSSSPVFTALASEECAPAHLETVGEPNQCTQTAPHTTDPVKAPRACQVESILGLQEDLGLQDAEEGDLSSLIVANPLSGNPDLRLKALPPASKSKKAPRGAQAASGDPSRRPHALLAGSQNVREPASESSADAWSCRTDQEPEPESVPIESPTPIAPSPRPVPQPEHPTRPSSPSARPEAPASSPPASKKPISDSASSGPRAAKRYTCLPGVRLCT